MKARHEGMPRLLLKLRAVDVRAHLEAAERDAVEKKGRTLDAETRNHRQHDEQQAGEHARGGKRRAIAEARRDRARNRHAEEGADAEAEEQRAEHRGFERKLGLHEGNDGRPARDGEAAGEETRARGEEPAAHLRIMLRRAVRSLLRAVVKGVLIGKTSGVLFLYRHKDLRG